MARHRLERVRPRYGRIAAALAACLITAASLAGGVGVLPIGQPDATAVPRAQVTPETAAAYAEVAAQSEGDQSEGDQGAGDPGAGAPAPAALAAPVLEPDPKALPEGSGSGKRVVYSESRQRVWLVAEGDRVVRTYPVSGSIYDNLDQGTYEVYSRSEDAVGIDDSGTMKYFVRFARGERAAIGFHDIPVHRGEPVQSVDELGTPLSHGCIRQRRADAIALWEFAPIGTTVVVTD